jgi:hypothetical protein
MNALTTAVRREFRVAFSPRAQPVWFRVLKWTSILVGIVWFHDRSWFWSCLAVLTLAAMLLHLLYRWKTKVWTRPWGGWNDLTAARD